MAAAINLPVFLRVGSTPEICLGDVTVDVTGDGHLRYGRPELAALLRAAANEVENPGPDDHEQEDSNNAPAHG